MNSASVVSQTIFILALPEFVQSWRSVIGSLCCCDWWCWCVSLRGNSSCSYLRFILTESPGSVLENKGCRVLCGVHSGLVQFTVNTVAGPSQRSCMSVCVWLWRLLSRCFHRVKLQGWRMKRTSLFRKLKIEEDVLVLTPPALSRRHVVQLHYIWSSVWSRREAFLNYFYSLSPWFNSGR